MAPKTAKFKYKAKSMGTVPMPTLNDIKKFMRPAVKNTIKYARADLHSVRRKFRDPAHRSKVRTTSGSGPSPFGPYHSVWAVFGIDEQSTPLVWLEDGTDKRYRVMSSNWTSRTFRAGGITTSSRVNRGMATYFDMDEVNARKRAIPARNFRDHIVERQTPRLHADARRAFIKLVDHLTR